jgi:hypothetical protein
VNTPVPRCGWLLAQCQGLRASVILGCPRNKGLFLRTSDVSCYGRFVHKERCRGKSTRFGRRCPALYVTVADIQCRLCSQCCSRSQSSTTQHPVKPFPLSSQTGCGDPVQTESRPEPSLKNRVWSEMNSAGVGTGYPKCDMIGVRHLACLQT